MSELGLYPTTKQSKKKIYGIFSNHFYAAELFRTTGLSNAYGFAVNIPFNDTHKKSSSA